MSSTEISARWYAAIPNLDERQAKVLQTIAKCPRASSRDVARIAKMDAHNVCCRITELLNAGKIEIVGEKVDRLTHRRVRCYQITHQEGRR